MIHCALFLKMFEKIQNLKLQCIHKCAFDCLLAKRAVMLATTSTSKVWMLHHAIPHEKLWFWRILHVRFYFLCFWSFIVEIDQFLTCHNVESYQISCKISIYHQHYHAHLHVHSLTQRTLAQTLKDRSNMDRVAFQVFCV